MGVYIVGMHRSGTSALAALVSHLGDLPTSRLAGGTSNPGGHWERSDLRPALELLLAANEATWMHPPASDHVMSPGALARPYIRRSFRALVASPFLWKDPRLCLTIDYWLAQPQPRPKVIFIHRPVDEVAASLARRDGWPLDRGRMLWEQTNRNALTRLAGVEVFVTSHARVISDPTGVALELQPWLGVRSDPARAEAAAALVRRGLSSSASSPPREETTNGATDVERHLAELGFGPTQLQAPPQVSRPGAAESLLGRPTRRTLALHRAKALRRALRSEEFEVAALDANST